MSGVLVDTSVWVSHFRRPAAALTALLVADQVLCHPLVVLELACGTPPSPRHRTLGDLKRLSQTKVATVDETLAMIEQQALFDTGCGAVDMALLAAVQLTPGARLWTQDKALLALAQRLGVAHTPLPH